MSCAKLMRRCAFNGFLAGAFCVLLALSIRNGQVEWAFFNGCLFALQLLMINAHLGCREDA